MKKVIAYYRKSTDPKGKSEEESVAYQQSRIQEYAQDNGLTIVHEFFDVGVTGVIDDRPELLKMFLFVEETGSKIEEILFYSIDRFGRDMLINIELLRKVVEKVGKARFVREGLATGAEYFNMLFLIYSGVAQSDRENLLRNLRDGRKAKVINYGNYDGSYTPLGLEVDTKTKKLVARTNDYNASELSKQELRILQTIFYSYLSGKSLRQIATILNNRFGLTKRGCHWDYKSVRYILSNPVYIGVLSGTLEGSEHYYREDSNIEILIDPIIFALVQKKLEFEKTGRKRNNPWNLPLLMLCRFCGNTLEIHQGKISCIKCESIEEEGKVLSCILRELEKYVEHKRNQQVSSEIKRRIILQYKIKLWKLETKLKSLLIRKNEIRTMELDGESKKRMLHQNTKLIMELLKESNIVHGLLLLFQKTDVQEVLTNLSSWKTNNLPIPFISLVDLVDKKTEILFLTSVLYKEVSTDGI